MFNFILYILGGLSMRFLAILIPLLALTACAEDGKIGMEGSPIWNMRASDAAKAAYNKRFVPYDRVMLSGEVITSNTDSWDKNITEVKYKGKLYTCTRIGNRKNDCQSSY